MLMPSVKHHESHIESDGSARAGSLRSSDGGLSYTAGTDEIGLDERTRIEHKMEQIKERLSRISLAREADVDDFLAMTSSMEGGSENPQLARVRQHFEKKNKKSAQEIEHLQKKLEQLQSKIIELDKGIVIEPSPRSAVLNNIRKTGPLLREVMSAPRGIAHMIKSTFGSADNIPDSVSNDASNVGHSTFYSNVPNGDRMLDFELENRDATASPTKRGHKRTETLPAMSFDLDSLVGGPQSQVHQPREPQVRFSALDNAAELRNDLLELQAQNRALFDQLNKLQTQSKSEFNYFNNALHEERIKTQRLEEILNETIELHQAEMIALKSDLNTVATRMDYQYSDRFRSIEENIESTQNKMIRVEANVKEWSEFRPQTTFSSVMLSGANILVEFLKLILFIVSFVLDFIRPFTGTRTRAGFVILLWSALMLLSHFIDLEELMRKIAVLLHLSSSSVNSTNA